MALSNIEINDYYLYEAKTQVSLQGKLTIEIEDEGYRYTFDGSTEYQEDTKVLEEVQYNILKKE